MNPEQKINNVPEKIITNESVQEVVFTEIVSEEDKQAKVEEKAQKEKENNEQIEKVREDLMKQFEGNEFGEARIDNPKILDMIAEIEFSTTIKDKEDLENAIQMWKRNIKQQYEESLKYFKKYNDAGMIYGRGGYDRFMIRDGEVYFKQGEPDPEKPEYKKAIELGMKIEQHS
jgi:tetratricopeptide (TPR) repeat protein